MNEQLIKDYVESAEPTINQQLRAGTITEEIIRFDTLFVEGNMPEVLFRFLPADFVNIDNGVMCDSGYMSCTDDIDKFMGKVEGNRIACLRISTSSPYRRILIKEVLPNHNDEGEYILPRGIRMKVVAQQRFEGVDGFTEFLEKVGSFESAETLSEIYHLESIDLYDMEIE